MSLNDSMNSCIVRISSLRGQNLACEPGTCNVFVTVNIGAKKVTTQVVQSENNSPIFTGLQACSFAWDGRSGLPSIEFFVWRRDEIRRTHTFIGQGRANLHASVLGKKEQRIMLTTRGAADAKLLNAFGTLGYLYFVADRDGPSSAASTPDVSSRRRASYIPPVQNSSGAPLVTQESFTPADVEPAASASFGRKEDSVLPTEAETAAPSPSHPGATEDEGPPRGDRRSTSANIFTRSHSSSSGDDLNDGEGDADEDKGEKKSAPVYDFDIEAAPRRTLTIDLQSASNLLGRDMGSPGDPFAIISGLTLEGDPIDLAQSDIRWSTNEPTWNRRFRMAKLDPSINAIEVMLFDYDEVGDNDFLGRAILPIDFTVSSAKTSVTVPLYGRIGGEPELVDKKLLQKERRENFGELQFGYQMETNDAPEPIPVSARKSLIAEQDIENSASISMRNRVSRRQARSTSNEISMLGPDEIPGSDDPFRARLKVTLLSLTSVPANKSVYAALAFGATGTTTRQCVDNASSAMNSGTAGICIMTYASDFVADARYEPLVVEARDSHGDGVLARGSMNVDIGAMTKPQTLTLQLKPESDEHANGGPVVATLLIASELLPCNIPSKLDIHSVLQFCVKKVAGLDYAHVSAASREANPACFVRVMYVVNEVEHEYTSPAVTSPFGAGGDATFYFEAPQIELGEKPDIFISAFVVDDNGFDECVGVTHLPFARLTASPDITLPLVPRQAQGTGGTAAVAGFVSISTRILPPRAAIRGTSTENNTSTSPTVVEVDIQNVTGLSKTVGCGNAVIRVVNTSNPTTTPNLVSSVRACDEGWDEEPPLRFQSVGVPESIRITVWDSAARAGATFLGEYDCFLQVPGEPVIGQVVTADLRPRQDVHFYASDVLLLNESTSGLGTIQFTVRTFSVREFEQRMREQLAAAGGGYTLHLQISEVSDVGKRSRYCVKAEVGGQIQATQTELSANPRFRYNLRLPLHYETEMLVLHLCESFDNVSAQSTVAEVSLPVQAPPADTGASETQSTWLLMRRTQQGSDGGPPPKVHLRWRTVAMSQGGPSAAGNVAIMSSAATPMIASGMRSRDPSAADSRPVTPNRDTEMAALREELTSLRMQISARKEQTQCDPFTINVYVPAHAQLLPFDGTTNSSAGDVIDFAAATLRLLPDDVKNCNLVRPGMQLERDSNLADSGLQEGETVFLVIDVDDAPVQKPTTPSQQPLYGGGASLPKLSPTKQTQRFAPSPPSASPPLKRTPNTRQSAERPSTELVSQRLRQLASKGVADSDVASTFITLCNVDIDSKTVDSVTTYANGAQLHGFARTADKGVEVFLQGKPGALAVALDGIAERSRAWRFRDPRLDVQAELAEGYIPVVLSGFRCLQSDSDADAAFEISCSGNPGGDVWFYYTNNFTFGTPGIRWVDERAEN